ncbi:phage portal protein [Ancylobacter mangrovi]|uniref:phage portal protein n=1 Tax=Ancylobacter mangrovi TaxID=2972472 RepID=UPI0021611110|nr:phage portal protein [Ancylobacter mangrovi]MCS0501387.1 phage portal protein [Ancylobacter mangrovi]
MATPTEKPRVRVRAPSRPSGLGAGFGSAPRASHMAGDYLAQAVRGWVPPLQSADAEWLYERDLSVSRVRDLVRNEGWAQAAIDRSVDMTVGATFRLNAKPDPDRLGISRDAAETFARQIEAKWREIAHDPTFRGDAERLLPFAGQVGLLARELVQVGEGLAVIRWKPRERWPYATALHIVDADRLSNPDGRPDDDRMRGGVELDADGAPIAYHIRRGHPGDVSSSLDSMTWDRIPRFDDVDGHDRWKVLHVYERRRPGQHRGISRLVAAVVKMRLLSRYSEAEVKAALLNGTIIGAVYTELGQEFAREALGDRSGPLEGFDWETFNTTRAGFYKAGAGMEDSRFLTLFPSDKLDLNTTPRNTAGFPAFQTAFLQGFAASLGLSYEQISMDWSRTNYSSARAALNEVWRTVQRLRALLIWGVAQPFYTAWLEDALDSGALEPPAGAPDFYDVPGAYAQAEWIGPGRGYVDPVKEAQAAALRIKARISTLEREAAEQGADWQMIVAQLAREQAALTAAGVTGPESGSLAAVKDDDEAGSPAESGRSAA